MGISVSPQETRLRGVKYLKAFVLFEQKRYDDAMDLFSAVSATPHIVISLFPPVIAGEWSQHEGTQETEGARLTENGDASVVASAIPDNVRASLDSPRRSKYAESDSSSILSKHTEISSSSPPGIVDF